MKSAPNNDSITTMGEETYVKPVWCGRDYIAKVGGTEEGREGGREEGGGRREGEEEKERGRSVTITEWMSAQFGLVSAV